MESYNFNKRLKQLLRFDDIRKLKMIEFFQYNFIGYIIVIAVGYILNKYFFKNTLNFFMNVYDDHTEQTTLGFILLSLIIILETFIVIVTTFYLRKILLLFPSIPMYINKNFKPLTTFDTVISITLSYLFLQVLSGYRKKIEIILDYEFLQHY
tara:strand:- start:1280 stop:1738 length:459 start_codon:yes stop_codon:yes gene_type:complete